ncbi:hypothetical protein AB1Y20_008029 [Prymnesium parvum]|uniref:GYF domain-containing protein n=1 Tax=Prymnesium parvum TaxID=97485 RepID=A0AB34IV85_PRYPA
MVAKVGQPPPPSSRQAQLHSGGWIPARTPPAHVLKCAKRVATGPASDSTAHSLGGELGQEVADLKAALLKAKEELKQERKLREEAEAAQQRVMEQLSATMASDETFFERSMERQRANAKEVLTERAAAQRQQEADRSELMQELGLHVFLAKNCYMHRHFAHEREKRELAEAAQHDLTEQLNLERQRRQAAEFTLAAQALRVQTTVPSRRVAAQPATVSISGPAITNNTSSSASDATWYFLDSTNAIRGPYDAATMLAWLSQGYFPSGTQVRKGSSAWFQLSHLGPHPFA